MKVKKLISTIVLFAMLIALVPTTSAIAVTHDAHWKKVVVDVARAGKNNYTFTSNGIELPRPLDLWTLDDFTQYFDATKWLQGADIPPNWPHKVDSSWHQGLKIKNNWDVYLSGVASNTYKINVKNNTLTVTGKRASRIVKNNYEFVGDRLVFYAVQAKFQLLKLKSSDEAYLKDGLAYADERLLRYCLAGHGIPTNSVSISTNTDTVLPVDYDNDDKNLEFTANLSNLSDGIYMIKELVYNKSDTSMQNANYWLDVLVVISNGKSSLQVTDIGMLEDPKAPEGRVTYGKYCPRAWSEPSKLDRILYQYAR